MLKRFASRSASELIETCWSCSTKLSKTNDIWCSKCHSIQKLPIVDHFHLFGIPKQFAVDSNDLTAKFRNFQSQIHPDKFSGKSDKEQELSSEWSSLINKAYQILQSPIGRAEYILKLNGIILPEGNTISDPEFLGEMMEKNEKVEEATTKDEIMEILQSLRDETTKLSSEFGSRYQSGSLEDAKQTLIKMKYLASIEKIIKEKLLRT